MTIKVRVGQDTFNFPEGTSEAEMKAALDKHFGVAKKEPVDTAAAPDRSFFEDTVNMARMAVDGFTIGAQADLVGAITAVGSVFDGTDAMVNKYREARQLFLDQNKQIKEEYGTAATVAELTGAIATPLKATKTIKGAMAQGAGIAALTGFMTADNDERTKSLGADATLGGAFSLATAGLTRGVGKLWNATSRRRIKEDLQKEDGSFTPITLADKGEKSAVKTLYKDLLSKSFAGGRKFRESEQSFLSARQEIVDLSEESYKQAKKEASDAFKQAKYDDQAELKRIKEEQDDLIKRLENEEAELKANSNVEIERIKSRSQAAKAKRIDMAISEMDRAFRRRAFSEALPSNANMKEIDNIFDSDDLESSVNILDELWKDSFKYIRERSFKFKTEDIEQKMIQKLGSDVGTVYNRADIEKIAKDMLAEMSENKGKSGTLSGDIVANMRAGVGTKAAKQADDPEGRMRAALLRSLKDVLDNDVIRPRLAADKSKDLLKKFEQDRQAYGTATVLREAVFQASKDPMRQGGFTANEWLQASAKNSRVQMRRGKATLQREAKEWAQASKARDEHITKLATDMQQRHIAAAQKDTAKRIASLQNKINEAKGVQKQASETMSARAQARDMFDISQTPEVAQAQKQLQQEKANLQELTEAAGGAKDPTFLTQLAANAVIAGGGFFGIPGVAAGAAIAKGLTTQTGQRLAAGQTGMQQGMQRFGGLVGDPLQTAIEAGTRAGAQQVGRD